MTNLTEFLSSKPDWVPWYLLQVKPNKTKPDTFTHNLPYLQMLNLSFLYSFPWTLDRHVGLTSNDNQNRDLACNSWLAEKSNISEVEYAICIGAWIWNISLIPKTLFNEKGKHNYIHCIATYMPGVTFSCTLMYDSPSYLIWACSP